LKEGERKGRWMSDEKRKEKRMPPRGFVLRPPLALSPSVCKGAYFDALCVLLRMRYSSYPLGSRHGALVLGGEREKRRRGRKRKKVLCGFFFFFFSFFSPTTPAINHNHTSTKAFQRESSEYLSLLLCSFLLRFDRSSQHHRNHSPGPDRKPLTLSLFSPLHPLSSQLSGRFSLNDALVLLPPTLSTLSSFSTPSTTRQTAC